MTELVLAGGLAVGFAVSFALLPLLHPIQIWLGAWAAAIGSHALRLLPFDDLGNATIAVVAASSVAFCAGALCGDRAALRAIPRVKWSERPMRLAAGIAFGLTVAGLALFLIQVAQRFGVRQAILVSADVRHALVAQEGLDAYRYVHAAMASTILCVLAAVGASTVREKRLWVVLSALSIGSLYFSTGRQLVIVAAVAALTIYGLPHLDGLRRSHAVASAGVVAVLALGIVITVGTIIGDKYSNNDLATFQNPFAGNSALRELGAVYLNTAAPIGAFDQQVEVAEPWGRANGCASLPVACQVLGRLGFGTEAEPRVRPFTSPPVPWNTYTFLDAPVIDFGPYLAPLTIGLLGLMTGVFWSLARRGLPEGVAAYSMLVAMLVFAGRQNLFAQAFQWTVLATSLIWLCAVLSWIRTAMPGVRTWPRG